MSEQEPKDFGQVLEKYMFDRGWTDGTLADCLKKNRVTVYRWRTEGRPPDASTLRDICDCLQLNSDQKKELYAAAGYLVVLGQPEPEARPEAAASAPVPQVEARPDEDAILATPEPEIIKVKLVDEMLNPPRKPSSFHVSLWAIIAVLLICLFLACSTMSLAWSELGKPTPTLIRATRTQYPTSGPAWEWPTDTPRRP